jgi:carboxylate-amine ligase
VDELGSDQEIAHIEKIMKEGTGADRQLAAWTSQHNMHDVVDLIVRETYEKLTVAGPATAAAT